MEPTIYKPSIYKGAGIYKTGANGGGGGGGVIPDEYFELEYLEISRDVGGANFVITLNPFSNKDKEFKAIVEFDGVNEEAQKKILNVSASISSSEPGFLLDYVLRTNNTKSIYSRNNLYNYYTPQYTSGSITNKIKLTVKNSDLTIENSDGTQITTSTNYSESILQYAFIFTDRTNPGSWYQFYGKFFELEIQDVVKLVPAKRKLDSVVGLFDLISQTFITPNYGASNIIAGPVKM